LTGLTRSTTLLGGHGCRRHVILPFVLGILTWLID
jgi:hypothetical protein